MQKRQTTLVVCLFFVLPASGLTPADKKKIVINQKEIPATTKRNRLQLIAMGFITFILTIKISSKKYPISNIHYLNIPLS